MARSRVALFIDSENASAKHLPDYLKRCNELGKLAIARCYGGTAGLKKWEAAMAEHHIVPMHTPPGASKKNASDFALTIDAVSLLHRNMFDHAVIASSDADFTQLATHIREHGKGIDGIGGSKATKPLQKAFSHYTVLPNASAKVTSTLNKKPATKNSMENPPVDTELLVKLFEEHDSDRPVTLEYFGIVLAAGMPIGYLKGYGNLTGYLEKSGVFQITEGVVTKK